jgi:hypothetical protein
MAMSMKRKRLGDNWGDYTPLDLTDTNLGKKFSRPRHDPPDRIGHPAPTKTSRKDLNNHQ